MSAARHRPRPRGERRYQPELDAPGAGATNSPDSGGGAVTFGFLRYRLLKVCETMSRCKRAFMGVNTTTDPPSRADSEPEASMMTTDSKPDNVTDIEDAEMVGG